MSEQEKLANRIKTLCSAKDMSYYTLSYRSAVPMTTLMHIIDCSTFFHLLVDYTLHEDGRPGAWGGHSLCTNMLADTETGKHGNDG